MRRRLFQLLTLCALGLPLSSGATCAWVLWEKIETHLASTVKGEPARRWELHMAAETRDECETMLTKVWQTQLHATTGTPGGAEMEATPPTPGVISETSAGKEGEPVWVMRTLYCFPATLDPRGPKSSS